MGPAQHGRRVGAAHACSLSVSEPGGVSARGSRLAAAQLRMSEASSTPTVREQQPSAAKRARHAPPHPPRAPANAAPHLFQLRLPAAARQAVAHLFKIIEGVVERHLERPVHHPAQVGLRRLVGDLRAKGGREPWAGAQRGEGGDTERVSPTRPRALRARCAPAARGRTDW